MIQLQLTFISEACIRPEQQEALPQGVKACYLSARSVLQLVRGVAQGKKPSARELTLLLPQHHFTLTRAYRLQSA